MQFSRRRPGRTVDEQRVEIARDDGEVVARGLWFGGRPSAGLHPWTDLVVDDLAVLDEIAAALGPGGSLMVAYEMDDTERALRRRVPPAATPLGLKMLRAGARWFKDWYYPEGGREGGTKLQGTLPLNETRKRKSEEVLVAELEEFLARRGTSAQDRRRAEEALTVLRDR